MSSIDPDNNKTIQCNNRFNTGHGVFLCGLSNGHDGDHVCANFGRPVTWVDAHGTRHVDPVTPKLRPLEEIEREANAATPGPWFRVDPPWRASDMPPWVVAGTPDPQSASRNVVDAFHIDEWDGDSDDHPGYSQEDADTEFIASARTDVPALVQRVRDLESEARASWLREEGLYLLSKHLEGQLAAVTAELAEVRRERDAARDDSAWLRTLRDHAAKALHDECDQCLGLMRLAVHRYTLKDGASTARCVEHRPAEYVSKERIG
jgi:hypothetical protein